MNKYKCNRCGFIKETDELLNEYFCEQCGVDSSAFEKLKSETRVQLSDDNPCIRIIDSLCTDCGSCYKTCKKVLDMDTPNICINCGMCKYSCPVNAIKEKYSYKTVKDFIENTDKCVVGILSPSLTLSNEFKNIKERQIVSALKRIGFDFVFSENFGLDLFSLEEANELLTRITNKRKLPMISSYCPSFVNYIEKKHKDIINNLSTCINPTTMEANIVKHCFAKIKGIKPDDIIIISISPCISNKFEAEKENSIDYSITSSELDIYLKEENISVDSLDENEYDSLFIKDSDYLEQIDSTLSMISSLYYISTGNDINNSNYLITNINDYTKEIKVLLNDNYIKIALVNGIKNLKNILEKDYDYIKVIICNSVCETDLKDSSINRYSYKNPDIIKAYENFLVTYGSNIANYLLHKK